MGVRVVERNYRDRFSETSTDWLLANVGDWQKAIFTVDASIDFFATPQQPIQIDELNNTFVIANGSKWGDFGFDNGMAITFSYKLETDTNGDGTFDDSQTITQSVTIENIFGNKMVVNAAITANDFSQMPLNLGRKKTTEVTFFVEAQPEGVKMQYAHLTNANSNSMNLTSFIDSTVTEFIAPNLGASIGGSWVNMQPTGNQSGMSIKNARVRRLQSGNSESFATGNVPSFSSILSVETSAFTNNRNYQNVKSIPLNVVGTQASYIVNVQDAFNIPLNPANGNPTAGRANTRFIQNVPSDVTHQISISVKHRVTSRNRVSVGNNSIKLVLYRYNGNNSMIFQDVTTLREWDNVEDLIGQELSYNNIISQSMLAGESYSLAFEYSHDPAHGYSVGNTYIGYSVSEGLIELSQPGQNFTTGSKNRYQFELEYMISSFFETFQNIQDRQIPSYLLNDGSLTDNFRFSFFPEWNNPNVLIENDLTETERKGNTGWFDENFNQLKNKFKVDTVEYFDEDSNGVNSLDYVSKTVVRIKVSGVPNLNTRTKCGIGFAWIPIDEDDYSRKETPFYQNIFVQSGDTEQGFSLSSTYSGPYVGAGVNGGSMNLENVSFTKQNDILVFEGVFSPNATLSSIFEGKQADDRNYALYLSVADGELERNYSDRVTLLADYRSLIKTIPSAGPYPYIENTFLQHPENETSAGSEKLRAIIQDDILVRMPFRIKKNDNTTFNSITFGVEMFNPALNRSFDLEAYSVDVSQAQTDANGVQQFNVSETRGFRLPVGNNKNIVSIQKSSLDTIDFSGFIALYAFRIRWEEWQANPNAPQDFFDSSLLNNGLNNDWYTYVTKQGWQINFFTRINATKAGEVLQYKNTWQFNIADYDVNTKLTKTHNYFRNSTNVNINNGVDPISGRPLGTILSNEETRIEIAYTILDSGTFVLANYYTIITIEIDRGQGQTEVRELTTVWDRESDNPLKGITTEARLTMELSANSKTITSKCIVDPDLLEDGARYRITGRIGCLPTGGEFNDRLYEFRYEDKYE